MTEKVLGFKKKDAQETTYSFSIKELSETMGFKPKDNYVVFKENLVPVVSLEWLEKYCEKHESIRDCVAIPSLLLAAKKEAEKRR